MSDQEGTGQRILTIVITLAGLSIIAFGIAQIMARQFLTGSIIVFIGVSDFAILFLFLRHLRSGPKP